MPPDLSRDRSEQPVQSRGRKHLREQHYSADGTEERPPSISGGASTNPRLPWLRKFPNLRSWLRKFWNLIPDFPWLANEALPHWLERETYFTKGNRGTVGSAALS